MAEEELDENEDGSEEKDEFSQSHPYKKFKESEIILGIFLTLFVDTFCLLFDGTGIGMLMSPFLQSVISLLMSWWLYTNGSKSSMKIGKLIGKFFLNFIPFLPTVSTVFAIEVFIHNHPKAFGKALKIGGKFGGAMGKIGAKMGGKLGGKLGEAGKGMSEGTKKIQEIQKEDSERKMGNFKNFKEYKSAGTSTGNLGRAMVPQKRLPPKISGNKLEENRIQTFKQAEKENPASGKATKGKVSSFNEQAEDNLKVTKEKISFSDEEGSEKAYRDAA